MKQGFLVFLSAALAMLPLAVGSQAGAQALPTTPKDGDEVAVLETDKGRIVLMFYPEKAPKHVAQFKLLVKEGFYDGVRFHRCFENFVIQGGDPLTKDLSKSSQWGTGGYMKDGKEVNIPLEPSDLSHTRGVLSMARAQDPDSASSQFFIMTADQTRLDRQYSAFGRVVTGMDVVDAIAKTGDPSREANGRVRPGDAVKIVKATLATWPLK